MLILGPSSPQESQEARPKLWDHILEIEPDRVQRQAPATPLPTHPAEANLTPHPPQGPVPTCCI